MFQFNLYPITPLFPSHTDSRSQSISGKGTSVLREAAEFPAVLKNELKFTENRAESSTYSWGSETITTYLTVV